MITENLQRVTAQNPCPHCGKPDWCYFLGELSICKRSNESAPGWRLTSKRDKDGGYFFAPLEQQQKAIRPAQKRIWEYPDREGNPFVRIIRIDDGKGSKPKRWQEHWNGKTWVKGLKGIKREDIPVYRYAEIQEAISQGRTIFIVEGESCADAMWSIGLPATTNIGGSKKWQSSDTEDLASTVKTVLCPDRDKPGIEHMEIIAADFPGALWLYAFPNSPFWNKLPRSQGADVADWIADYKLDAKRVLYHVGEKRNQMQKEATQISSFSLMCAQVDEINAISCPGERKWMLYKLAKENRVSVPQIMTAYEAALTNQPTFEGVGIKDLLAKTPERFDWLVAALMPMATTALLYAEAGTGKTLFVNNIIKAVAGGQDWNGYPTKHGKVLYIQTDEPEVNTAHNLKEAGFESVPNENLTIYFKWQFSQMAKLRETIEKEKPKLVVIDSLTSCNRNSSVEEKNVEYARTLYELRDIAMETGCAIIVLHHENKNGQVRGTTAIKANVSEVWHLKTCDKLSSTHRLLQVEKSRAGCNGTRELRLDTYDLSWQDLGEYDPKGQDRGTSSSSTGATLLAHLKERPGVIFEPSELVHEFGKSRDAIRKALARLHKTGLLDCQSKVKTLDNGNAVRYKVYYFPNASSVSKTTTPSESETMDTKPKTNNLIENVQRTKAPTRNDDDRAGREDEKNDVSNSSDGITVDKSETSILEIGSRVANNNHEKKSYNWHGKIVGFDGDGAKVCWDERKGIQGGQVLWHRLTELRLL
ncbi:MAG: AAA family ATPase [Xenococcus sp. MO_188.B8]|nr:AAA family ATPase [Xenococcus sp. MO_188.B8]